MACPWEDSTSGCRRPRLGSEWGKTAKQCSSHTNFACLRNPDVVIATPGRLIDHLQNTPGFSLDSIEVLVLDEADRMLAESFLEQMTEIIRWGWGGGG